MLPLRFFHSFPQSRWVPTWWSVINKTPTSRIVYLEYIITWYTARLLEYQIYYSLQIVKARTQVPLRCLKFEFASAVGELYFFIVLLQVDESWDVQWTAKDANWGEYCINVEFYFAHFYAKNEARQMQILPAN